jgi:hypothetical protein
VLLAFPGSPGCVTVLVRSAWVVVVVVVYLVIKLQYYNVKVNTWDGAKRLSAEA